MPATRPVARALLALVAACNLVLASCNSSERAAPPPAAHPDEHLETLVPSLVDAIQAKQGAFVMEHVSHSFKEERGLDYYDVRALVEKLVLVKEPVGARLESAELTPDGDSRSRVSARVAFAPGRRLAQGEALPDEVVVYAFELLFAKNEGRWEAIGGSYKRVSPPATSPAAPPTSTR